MTIDWGSVLQKVPELGMVFLVVYFALEMTKMQREGAKTTMQEWREFLRAESEANRTFLSDLREQQNTVISRLAEEQKVVGQQLAALTAIINAHDVRSQERSKRSSKGEPYA